MRGALLSVAASSLAACGASPDDKLLRLGDEMSSQSWDCWEAVNSGADLLATESCKQFVALNDQFNATVREREEEYENSLEYEAREIVGLSKELGYFLCDAKCWEARAYAGSAHQQFRHTIIVDIGCHPSIHSNFYFFSNTWDDIRRFQAETPCKARVGETND